MIFLQVEINKQHITPYIKNNVDDLKEQKDFYNVKVTAQNYPSLKMTVKNKKNLQEKSS